MAILSLMASIFSVTWEARPLAGREKATVSLRPQWVVGPGRWSPPASSAPLQPVVVMGKCRPGRATSPDFSRDIDNLEFFECEVFSWFNVFFKQNKKKFLTHRGQRNMPNCQIEPLATCLQLLEQVE